VDPATFEAAVAPHYPALLQRLTLVLRDPHAAEDAAQEAYLRAYRAWARFDGADVRAWLYTIGLRVAFNELRRRRRWSLLQRPMAPSPAWQPATDPDLWAAVGTLEPRHRAALVLHVVDGYTQAEVGSMLGVPAGTVGSWISRDKALLRRDLEP
jgi:RNA polymerase sigma-70 factor (ECF subfamily)